ncbi:MAG: Ig-like domain-containing protein, partial [bacterium]|nr:Ig-like domain-containing protein [bacterium]
NPSNRQIVFTPVAGLKGSTLYIATIQKGIIAEAVPYPYSWYFITQDMVQPRVSSTTPNSGDDFFDPNEAISVRFNKTMNINMLQENIFSLKDSKGNTVSGSLIYDLENNNLIFTPENALLNLESYTAAVYSKFQDMGGHPLTSDYTWNFRTTQILSSAGGDLESSDGKIRLRVPKNALNSDTAISISRIPVSSIPPSSNPNLKSIKLAYAFEPSGLTFNKAVTIKLSYPDDNNNGNVDDPDTKTDILPGVPETKLSRFYYNTETGSYERVGGTVDTAENAITASIRHFSTFALFQDDNTYNENLDITEINTYPRIFSPSKDGNLDINYNVKLSGTGKATVKIYNLAGRLVKELKNGMTVSQGINYLSWDGKDKDNDVVHDRMYVLFIHLTDSSGKEISKTKTLVVME